MGSRCTGRDGLSLESRMDFLIVPRNTFGPVHLDFSRFTRDCLLLALSDTLHDVAFLAGYEETVYRESHAFER